MSERESTGDVVENLWIFLSSKAIPQGVVYKLELCRERVSHGLIKKELYICSVKFPMIMLWAIFVL